MLMCILNFIFVVGSLPQGGEIECANPESLNEKMD